MTRRTVTSRAFVTDKLPAVTRTAPTVAWAKVLLVVFVIAAQAEAVGQRILIENKCAETLYHHTVRINLSTEHLPTGQTSPDFNKVRFYNIGNEPLSSWLSDEQPGDWATFWVRIPVLEPGENFISFTYDESGATSCAETSLVARLLAEDGLRLELQTDPPDKETVHPSVVVAEGWMTKLSPDGNEVVNRVLVDTMWPSDPSPYASPNELENPAVWLSEDSGNTWAWPPGVDTNPAWPLHNNWLVGPPPYDGFHSDPDAIFLRANSLPAGGPETDTLRVYHRTTKWGQTNVMFIDVDSTDGSWSGVEISGFNPTNLTFDPSWGGISPAVWQEPDGSILMWVGNRSETYEISMQLYNSLDGVNFDLVGDLDLGLPKNLWGPWHFDVIKAAGVYWMTGSFGAIMPGAANMRDSYMLRSEDGLKFTLLLPTVLEAGLSNHWFYPGTYRPSMLYIPGEGLEFYIGSNARNEIIPAVRGGTGRWVDPNWAPDFPRPVEAITSVFWASAREFTDDPREWPHPWYEIDDAPNSTTIEHTNSVLTIIANLESPPRGKADSVFYRPQNHEFYMKLKIDDDCYAALQGNGYYGPWVDSRNEGLPPRGVEYRWGSPAMRVCGPAPIGDINDFHTLGFRRLADQGWLWWDGNDVPGSPFVMEGREVIDDLAWQIGRVIGTSLYVDWYFYRDAVDPEPLVYICPLMSDLDGDCDVDLYDFAVFALAWLSTPGENNWNPACDLSDPNDSVIDGLDLAVFTEKWLTGL